MVGPGSPANSLLTLPGNSGTALGNGFGLVQTAGTLGSLDVGESLSVGAVAISNVAFSGTLSDPNYVFAPGGVSGVGTRVLRSQNFTEASAGLVLTQGADTIGFGLATGSLGSNLPIENNFGTGGTPSSVFARQSGPYTLAMTSGTTPANIKGIGLGYDVSYDITPVPEPASGLLAALGVAALAGAGRRTRRAC
jgi:hypothetical protein